MAKPWEKAPRRAGRSKLRLLFHALLAYTVYLVFWGCPGADNTDSHHATFSPLRPCATLHTIYDTQLSPLWNQYGQPVYEKVEPYSTPVISKLEPISTKARDTFNGHVGVHYEHVKCAIAQHLKPLGPHYQAARTFLHKYASLSAPHVQRLLGSIWEHIKTVYGKTADMYLAHVAPKLTVYLTELDKRQVALVEECTNWANHKYEEALHQVHKWLSDKVANTLNGGETAPATPAPTDEPASANSASATSATGESTESAQATELAESTVLTSTHKSTDNMASTIPSGSTDADDFIQIPAESTSVQGSYAKKIKIGKATGPGGHQVPVRNVPRKIDWASRVTRTANSAKKNFEHDATEHQTQLMADAKPGLMQKLRELSQYGEDNILGLFKFVHEVETDQIEGMNDEEFYGKFDNVAKHAQDILASVRADCESLAQTAINKVGELRKESLESLDDFFDIVLIEAGKEVAEDDSGDSDGEEEWAKWQEFSKLKKQIAKTRKEIEEYEPSMETVNTAIRESQQAAIILTQEFIQHIKTLRARAQFHVQQKAALLIQELQGQKKAFEGAKEPIDAEWQVIGDNGEVEDIPDFTYTESDPESDESVAESESLDKEAENDFDFDDDFEDDTLTQTVTSVIYETKSKTEL